MQRDHPRVCGEKAVFDMCSCHSLGSPPRMRGKDVQPCRFGVAVRITPAYAGKSVESMDFCCLLRDHPRVCGEKLDVAGKRKHSKGSPPRMRGKGQDFVAVDPRLGITPAYAGKSTRDHVRKRLQGDHPRVCGEKAPPKDCIAAPIGSPPRMRGKV